jgi:hypothetical protein
MQKEKRFLDGFQGIAKSYVNAAAQRDLRRLKAF